MNYWIGLDGFGMLIASTKSAFRPQGGKSEESMKRLLTGAVVTLVFCLVTGGAAKADSIQLQCGTCSSGSVTQISNSGPVQFSFVNVSAQTITGDAFIAILVPTGGVAPSLTGGSLVNKVSFTSGDLQSVLLGTSFDGYNLSNFQSASAQQGIAASGYTVYEYSVGKGVTLGPSGAGITGLSASAPQGSVIVGFVDPPDTFYQTPLSESITMPEPSSLELLVLGLVGFLGVSLLRLRQEIGSARP